MYVKVTQEKKGKEHNENLTIVLLELFTLCSLPVSISVLYKDKSLYNDDYYDITMHYAKTRFLFTCLKVGYCGYHYFKVLPAFLYLV